MGKSISDVEAPTIDPSGSIQLFQNAADTIRAEYPGAFAEYQNYVSRGTQANMDAISTSIQANLPFSDTAREATNELRSFMGLKPISKTAAMGIKLDTAINKLKASPISNYANTNALLGKLTDMKGNIERLEEVSDPNQRATLAGEITQGLKGLNSTYEFEKNVWTNEQKARNYIAQNREKFGIDDSIMDTQAQPYTPASTGGSINPANGQWAPYGGPEYGTSGEIGMSQWDLSPEDRAAAGIVEPTDTPEDYGLFNFDELAKRHSAAVRLGDDRTIKELEEVTNFFERDFAPDVRNIEKDFTSNFEPEQAKALTGQEIQSKLEELPEYQFQLKQGEQALGRSQAARGEQFSGRAMLEAQDFGQQLAQNIYNSHTQRLAGLAGMTLPQVNQQAGLTQAGGQAASGQQMSLGQQSQGYLQGIANARSSAFNQAGQTLHDTNKTNANMQLQASLANQQAEIASAKMGMQGLGMGMKMLGGLF